MIKKLYPFLLIVATPVVLLLMANSGGSPGGKSGSIGDNGNTCTDCHSGSATTMSGWITTNVPTEGYTPGQTYTITATGTHSGVVKFGFELTVENSDGDKVGTLQLTEPTRTKFTNASQAVTHTAAGNVPSGNTNSWTMNWVAPSNVDGNVGIYAAFNAANGNGNTSGDVIYKSSIFISEVAPPPVLVSIVPNQAEQGDSFQATITGSNTAFAGNPTVSMSYSNNGFEIINATGVVVVSPTVIQAQFSIPSSASVGLWDVHVNDLDLDNGFTVNQAVPAILFMEPNFAHQGDSFSGTVFGENTGWSGTPSVFLSHTVNPDETITGTNVIVVSPTEITADFDVPADAMTGNYNVFVDGLSQSNGFTVLQAATPALTGIDPDNGEQGSLVMTTITAENTMFGGSDPLVSLSLHSNPAEIITASGVTVINNTTLQADFDLPYEATPGLWDLHVDDLVLTNTFTLVDVVPFLVGIEPDSALRGETVTTVITAADSRFTLSEPVIFLNNNEDPLETIAASSVTVINDFTAEAVFTVPASASTGFWDLNVDEMILDKAFTVLLVSGLGDLAADMLKIYPNPADQQFFIDNAKGSELSVYRTNGELVMKMMVMNEKQTVNISELSRGLYLVKIHMNGITRVEKLLVN
ncbi:MAG: T9SS type A sorting domain-containing protein [Bacteroidales bacterium]|nr:T9SS type A sorting domain-containing protein [Bacteroidales bacterium]